MTTDTLPEGTRIASDNEAGWTYHGLWITDAPADENEQHDIPSADYEQHPRHEGAFAALRTPPAVVKEIIYVAAGDYDCFVTIDGQREYIGSAPSYHDGELKCNNYAYNFYTDNHTSEVAAAIAVEEFSTEPPSRHTPGPWRANNLLIEVANGMAAEVATVRSVGVGCAARSTEQAKANARLIAAAPELLDALHATLRVLSEIENRWSGEADHAVAQARAAIAKASPGGA